jgi:hypothetical protein
MQVSVRVHPLAWLFWLFIYVNMPQGLMWVGALSSSLVIHEMGHALFRHRLGQEVQVELFGIVGRTTFKGRLGSFWQEAMASCAGFSLTLLSAAIARLLLLFYPHPTIDIFYIANLAFLGINLVPIEPCDAGCLLSQIFSKAFGIRGYRFSLALQILSAVAASLFLFSCQSEFAFLLSIGVLTLAVDRLQALRGAWKMEDADRRQPFQKRLEEAESLLKQGLEDESFARLIALKEKVSAGQIAIRTRELLAHLHCKRGELNEGFQLILPLEKELSSFGISLLQQIHYHLGHWSEALKLGRRLFQEQSSSSVAFINAIAANRLSQEREARGWLGYLQKEHPQVYLIAVSRPEFGPSR